MIRKIVQQGPSTLMVSLPSKWVRLQGLVKGDEIDLVESGSCLLLNPGKKMLYSKATVALSDYGDLASRAIGALYKQGFDEIEIFFRDAKDMAIVNKNVSEFIGFEIVSQSAKGCTIREVSAPTEDSFELILNRFILLLKGISKDMLDYLSSGDIEGLRGIPARDVAVNKYANYCRRIIIKQGQSRGKSPLTYYLIEEMEKLGDGYKDLAGMLQEENTVDRQFIEYLSKLDELLDILYHLVLKFDIKGANELNAKRLSLDRKIKAYPGKKTGIVAKLHGMSEILGNTIGPLLTANLS